MKEMQVFAIHYQDMDGSHRLDTGEPVILESEWSGGPVTKTEFSNLRFTDRQSVVIDKSEDGVMETITLFQLAQ